MMKKFHIKPAGRRDRQRGLTLVELMVAMVISLIIMAGVGTLYVSTKRNYIVEDAFSRLQENGRYAADYMSMIVRDAGYVGCASGLKGKNVNTLNQNGSLLYNFATGIEGYEFTGTAPGNTYPSTQPTAYPAVDTNAGDWSAPGTAANGGTPLNLPTDIINTNLMLPGSDVVVIRSASGTDVEVVQNNSSAQLFLNNKGKKAGACPGGTDMYSGLCTGDVLVVSDCQKSVTFQATNIQATGGCPTSPSGLPCLNVAHSAGSSPGNQSSLTSWGGANPKPSMSFGPGAEVMGVSTKVFFIGKGASGLPSLYIKEGAAAAEELVGGVENMQVLYGLDTDNNDIADEYVTADNVKDPTTGYANFDNVVSVRISLLLMTVKTLNNRPADTKTYPLAGVWDASGLKTAVEVHPVKDKRLRKILTFTIKLRNRAVKL